MSTAPGSLNIRQQFDLRIGGERKKGGTLLTAATTIPGVVHILDHVYTILGDQGTVSVPFPTTTKPHDFLWVESDLPIWVQLGINGAGSGDVIALRLRANVALVLGLADVTLPSVQTPLIPPLDTLTGPEKSFIEEITLHNDDVGLGLATVRVVVGRT